MRSSRPLLVIGTACTLVAGLSLAAGAGSFPWITLGALAGGAALLVTGLVMSRGRPDPGAVRVADPARGERLVRVAVVVMAILGSSALVVALIVPEQEAQGHAIGHLLTGVFAAALFAALAFPWHPRPGTGAATVRGIVLSLLAVAAIGAFVESLGGSGYDETNTDHRIEALTTLHNAATPFAALVVGAVPIGCATGIVVATMWAVRRHRSVAV